MNGQQKRFLFLGLGLGMIFSALIYQLSGKPEITFPLAESEVEAWLSDHGYVKVSSEEWSRFENEKASVENTQLESKTAIYILPGMNGEEVTELLMESKLISDPEQFASTMKEKELESRIRAGLYSFQNNPTVDEVLNRITR